MFARARRAAMAGLMLISVFAVSGPAPAVGATTFVVDTTSNDPARTACTAAADDCSLPGAVVAANATGGLDTITFAIPAGQCPDGVCPINIVDGPMTLTEAAVIDATTQPQHGGPQANVCATADAPSYPRIEVITDPNETTSPESDAFVVAHASGSTTIKGFAIASDEATPETSAIVLSAGSQHHVACNHFEIDSAGAANLGASNYHSSVSIQGTAGDVIIGTDGDGIDDIGERNIFGPGGAYAVYINGTDNNVVAGNYFGVSADGTTKVGSGRLLIREGANFNLVGTDDDGTSDDLERNYFGSGLGVDLIASLDFSDNTVVGNHFGVTPNGTAASISTGVSITELSTTGTGIEIRDNVFGSSSTGITIAGTEAGAGALVTGNSFGATADGVVLQGNTTAIELADAGTHTISDNYIANSKTTGIALSEDAGITASPTGNCLVGNAAGFENNSSGSVAFENNWWGAVDGPSGAGSGSGDTVSANVDFDPWLDAPPAICNTAPVVDDVAFDVDETASVGTDVGTIEATDVSAVVFDITAGDPSGDFAVSSSGELTVAKTLDFETTAMYELTVTVSDSLLSTDATVTVNVVDVFEIPSVASFGDVPTDHTFFSNIEWLAYEGITRGCNPPANDMFCPDQSVTRGQMAAFLRRALGDDLVAGEPVDFTDDDGSIFEDDIEWLASVRITKGCNPPVNDMFCPDDPVTRGQMAAFMVRAFNYRDGAGSDQFTDDDDSPFEENIERLAHAGVTRGCNPPTNDLFCPNAPVTRAQMAAFLNRAMGS